MNSPIMLLNKHYVHSNAPRPIVNKIQVSLIGIKIVKDNGD